jgi:hypothetical protein
MERVGWLGKVLNNLGLTKTNISFMISDNHTLWAEFRVSKR